MKTQKLRNELNSAKYFAGAVVSAVLMTAMTPVCFAQDMPVNVMPKTPPPTAPAITVPGGVPGAGAAPGAGQAEPPAPPAPRISALHAPAIPGVLSSVTHNAGMGNTLHVTLGHSLFIDTKTRLRRVYISDPSVVSSVTLSPNQIIVTGMNPGVSSLTLLDEAGMAQSYVVSADLDIDALRTAMAEAMRGDSVKIEGTAGRVTLSGTVSSDAQVETAMKLASLYSKDVANAMIVTPAHQKQVRLQVRILEVDRTKALQLGINLFSPGGNSSFIATSTSSQYPTASTVSPTSSGTSAGILSTTNPLSFLFYSYKLNLGTTIQDLQTKQVLQILAEPTITTISGVKADFLSGGEFPFPSVQPSSGAGSAPVVSVSFRPFGVKLEFTPIVNEDGTIRLKVSPEVSALDYSNAISVSGTTVPALSTRRATTEVELRSEQSFAISGLLDQRTTDIMTKNPGAASIPILGNFFKAKNQNHNVTELVVVVTPTVVDPLAEMAAPSEPEMPIKTLEIPKFDKSLGKNLDPDPVAPPITPDHPPVVPPVFPPSTAPTGAKGAAGNTAPAESPQSAPAGVPVEPAVSAAVPAPAGPTSVVEKIKPAVGAIKPVAQVFTHPDPKKEPAGQGVARQSAPMVEVMALSHESDADVMVAALKRRGYSVVVVHAPTDALLHLDVGPFASKSDAEAMRQRLVLDGYNATTK